MGLAILSISIIIFILHLIFGGNPETARYAGLAMGVYTGGTPNIASIKTAIGVDESTFTIFNTYDMVISIGYMLIVLSSGKFIIKKIFRLKDFEGEKNVSVDKDECTESTSYKGFLSPKPSVSLCSHCFFRRQSSEFLTLRVRLSRVTKQRSPFCL